MSYKIRDFLDDVTDWSMRVMAAMCAVLGAAGLVTLCAFLAVHLFRWWLS